MQCICFVGTVHTTKGVDTHTYTQTHTPTHKVLQSVLKCTEVKHTKRFAKTGPIGVIGLFQVE